MLYTLIRKMAKILCDEVYAKHGMPQVIISDWGTVFISKFMKDLYNLLQIKSNTSLPSIPRLMVRLNESIKKSKNTFAFSSIISKPIRWNGSLLLLLLTIIVFTFPLAKVPLKSITVTIQPFFQVQDWQYLSKLPPPPHSYLKCRRFMLLQNAL